MIWGGKLNTPIFVVQHPYVFGQGVKGNRAQVKCPLFADFYSQLLQPQHGISARCTGGSTYKPTKQSFMHSAHRIQWKYFKNKKTISVFSSSWSPQFLLIWVVLENTAGWKSWSWQLLKGPLPFYLQKNLGGCIFTGGWYQCLEAEMNLDDWENCREMHLSQHDIFDPRNPIGNAMNRERTSRICFG